MLPRPGARSAWPPGPGQTTRFGARSPTADSGAPLRSQFVPSKSPDSCCFTDVEAPWGPGAGQSPRGPLPTYTFRAVGLPGPFPRRFFAATSGRPLVLFPTSVGLAPPCQASRARPRMPARPFQRCTSLWPARTRQRWSKHARPHSRCQLPHCSMPPCTGFTATSASPHELPRPGEITFAAPTPSTRSAPRCWLDYARVVQRLLTLTPSCLFRARLVCALDGSARPPVRLLRWPAQPCSLVFTPTDRRPSAGWAASSSPRSRARRWVAARRPGRPRMTAAEPTLLQAARQTLFGDLAADGGRRFAQLHHSASCAGLRGTFRVDILAGN